METLTAKEIAEKMGLNVEIVRRKLKSGEIKGKRDVRGSSKWLVTKENFLEYTGGIEELVLIDKFAKSVHRCIRTIRDKILNGELRGIKLGGRWYVDSEEINKFV